MSWLQSFSLVMRSSITSLREKVEDPERLLNQMIIDMDEELLRVRESVAAAIADEILLRNKSRAARDEAQQWDQRAAEALARGDESGAKSALEQKIMAEQRAHDLSDEHDKQRTETARLHDAVRDLEDKIRQARQKRTLLLARLVRADSSQRINAALERTESDSAFAQFNRLEQRVERAEAISEAWERMEGRDPDARELERKFAEEERKEKVARQLEELKRRVQDDK
jgi:phage shock protein A